MHSSLADAADEPPPSKPGPGRGKTFSTMAASSWATEPVSGAAAAAEPASGLSTYCAVARHSRAPLAGSGANANQLS